MTSDQDQLQRRISALMTMQSIAQELTSELDPWRLLNKILDHAIRVLTASSGSLLVFVPPDTLEFVASSDAEIIGHRMPADAGIAGCVFTNEKPLIVGDASQDSRHFRRFDEELGNETRSLIAVPLMTPTGKIGVIEVLNKTSGEPFDEQDQDILTALAAQAAIAYVNADLYQELAADKHRIIAMEDEIHKKLARDLHDGPAQILASMIMSIDLMLRLHNQDPADIPEELRSLRDAAGRALTQVRTTLFELRPVILERQGLKAAIESYAERLLSTETFDIHLDIQNLNGRLPPRMETHCFVIIREAVNNVRKHARAANMWIALEQRERDLVIAVRDDGIGFDVASVEEDYDRRDSLGLLNIKERAEAMGARHKFVSTPGSGTLLYLIAPIARHPLPQEASQESPHVLEGITRYRPRSGHLPRLRS